VLTKDPERSSPTYVWALNARNVEGPIDMTTQFNRGWRPFRSVALALPLLACLAGPVSGASTDRARTAPPCQDCSECEGAQPKVVGLKIYNQPAISDADVNRILQMANQLWNRYGVTIEPSTRAGAIAVILASRPTAGATDSRPAVLGDTLFSNGHATPYIRLWPANAEALATESEINGRPFTSLSRVERDAILLRMLGVALAHELAHYLLDTSSHAAGGLLRNPMGVNELASAVPSHLRLSRQQQQLICRERWTEIPDQGTQKPEL
jgi:hypothetical protein